ncbi:MAG: hypothetical protein VX252_09210 [Myxococcota bacterium]|nr:hypothetical protein [Myxococcota bacterium]
MDHGGRISREFAKAELRWEQGGEILTEDLVLFTWAGDGSKSEHLTLFAFCADGDCDDGAPRYDVAGSVSNPNCEDVDAKDPQVTFPVPSPHCQLDQGCFWSRELPDSRGDISYSPPVSHQVGDQTLTFDDADTADRVFVATSNDGGGGTVWSFDLDGACNWGTKFSNKQAKSGFYARPAVQELGASDDPGEGRVVFIPSLNNSKMQVLFDGSSTAASGLPWGGSVNDLDSKKKPGIPIDQPGKSGGRVRFEPIVECNDPCYVPEVYVGATGGGSKRGLYHFHVCPTSFEFIDGTQCEPDSAPTSVEAALMAEYDIPFLPTGKKNDEEDGYRLAWDILNPDLNMILGGVMIGDATQRYLVATLDTSAGAAVLDISRAEESSDPKLCNWKNDPDEGEPDPLDCFAIHPEIRATHRTRPTAVNELLTCDTSVSPSVCSCEVGETNCAPVVYIGQKEGAPKGGGQVWKFRLRENPSWPMGQAKSNAEKWDTALENQWSDNAYNYTWPACLSGGTGKIPTTSWSSPVVHPEGRSVFVSSRNGAGGGIHVIRQDQEVCPFDSTNVDSEHLLDFYPKEGWRTTGIFTEEEDPNTPEEQYRLHYGSSNDKFYTLNPDVNRSGNGCDSVLWCYDIDQKMSLPIGKLQGGFCDGSSAAPDCCTCQSDDS